MFRKMACISALALILTGCPDVLRSPQGIAPVSGKVIYQDVPVNGAFVTFVPDKGPKANGTTNIEGNFTLTTTLPNDGAVVGPHRITIQLYDAMDPNSPYAERKSLLPSRYSSFEESGLKEVVGAKSNHFEFKLVN